MTAKLSAPPQRARLGLVMGLAASACFQPTGTPQLDGTESSTTSTSGTGTGTGTESSTAPTSGASTGPALPEVPVLTLKFSQIKQFEFEWAPAGGADYYQLWERVGPDDEEWSKIVPELDDESVSLTMPLHLRFNASYRLDACTSAGDCTESAPVTVADSLATAVGYLKASNPDRGDEFGLSLALSGDGNTLAVGARQEDSGSTENDIGGSDNSATDAGAVYVFVRGVDDVWAQQAYIKAPNAEAQDNFGAGVALSKDGNTLAIGARHEASAATGVDGDALDNSAPEAGAVYVFVRADTTWIPQAYLKASNSQSKDEFGTRVELSDDGNTLAVGAPREDSTATGVGGDENNDDVDSNSGAAYVFVRVGEKWSQQEYFKSLNTNPYNRFGDSLALSGDGNTLAVGAYFEDDQSGAVYVYERDGNNTWSASTSPLKASPSKTKDDFGVNLALSGDGTLLAVGAPSTDSAPGSVHVFIREGNDWHEKQPPLVGFGAGDRFGINLALSNDGNLLAVGADNKAGSASGVSDGAETDKGTLRPGAVHVFTRNSDNSWSSRAYVKASNPDAGDQFGYRLTLSDDGNTLAVGARREDSINGDPSHNNDESCDAGAVYLY